MFLGAIAIFLGFFLSISAIEWCFISLSIGLVLSTEAINTSLETICDKTDSGYDESIKKVKDIAAAAALISSMAALVVGSIIYLPKLIE